MERKISDKVIERLKRLPRIPEKTVFDALEIFVIVFR